MKTTLTNGKHAEYDINDTAEQIRLKNPELTVAESLELYQTAQNILNFAKEYGDEETSKFTD